MSKPTEIELKTALIAAETMKEHDKDPFYIAKTLLNHNFRLNHYEDLLKAADSYMNRGQSERDRMTLLKCIENIKDVENRISNETNRNFGL